MKLIELFESSRTLYHATLKEFVPSILKHGLWTSLGDFTKSAYSIEDEDEDEHSGLVFATDKNGLGKCMSAIIGWMRVKDIPITEENFKNYGAIIVLKDSEHYFNHRSEDDENTYGEHPYTVEPGDYYKDSGISVDGAITGKKMMNFFRKYGVPFVYTTQAEEKEKIRKQKHFNAKLKISENTNIPNPEHWKKALEPLTKQLYREYRDREWTWTTGGCFAFAEAFQAAYGGELYGVCSQEGSGDDMDFPVEHAIIKLGGKFYDYNGIFDIGSVKPPYMIKSRDDDYVFWFEDDFLNDKQWKKLFDTMKLIAKQN